MNCGTTSLRGRRDFSRVARANPLENRGLSPIPTRTQKRSDEVRGAKLLSFRVYFFCYVFLISACKLVKLFIKFVIYFTKLKNITL